MIDTDKLADSFTEFFAGLDYEYMIFQTILCYGLYYSKNFEWICRWFAPVHKKGRSKAVWLFGAIFAVLEMVRFSIFMGINAEMVQKCYLILYSFVIIQVFVEPIVNAVHGWVGVFKKGNDLK